MNAFAYSLVFLMTLFFMPSSLHADGLFDNILNKAVGSVVNKVDNSIGQHIGSTQQASGQNTNPTQRASGQNARPPNYASRQNHNGSYVTYIDRFPNNSPTGVSSLSITTDGAQGALRETDIESMKAKFGRNPEFHWVRAPHRGLSTWDCPHVKESRDPHDVFYVSGNNLYVNNDGVLGTRYDFFKGPTTNTRFMSFHDSGLLVRLHSAYMGPVGWGKVGSPQTDAIKVNGQLYWLLGTAK